jgi:hypothetical protein
MSNGVNVNIEGLRELKIKITKLGDDKSKTKEVRKILNKIAQPTLVAARNLAPVSNRPMPKNEGSGVKRKRQKPGTGKRSLAKKIMTRAAVPMVTISPRSRSKADGFYLRQFNIPETKQKPEKNYFLDKAYKQTAAGVTSKAAASMAKYFEKQIEKLSK